MIDHKKIVLESPASTKGKEMLTVIFYTLKQGLLFTAVLSALTKFLNVEEIQLKLTHVIPKVFAPSLVLLLGVAEVIVCVLLGSNHYLVPGLLLMLSLHAVYTIYLIFWTRGEEGGCGCFGFTGFGNNSRPVDIARNTAIILTIILLIFVEMNDLFPDDRIVATFITDNMEGILSLTMSSFAALFLILYDRQLSNTRDDQQPGATEFMAKLSRRNLGNVISDFEMTDPEGNPTSIMEKVREDINNIIIFLSSTCPSCRELLDDLANLQTGGTLPLNRIIVILGNKNYAKYVIGEHRELEVFYSPDMRVLESFYIAGTPGAVVVNGKGEIIVPL